MSKPLKRNGMCPLCHLKKIFTRPSAVTENVGEPYENGAPKTPPMGWSSWNTFRNRISEDMIFETAQAMASSGLKDAGYTYINLDDNWHSSERDENDELQGDLTTFPHGIPALVKKINALGLKVGIYSSNGTETCEDLPASLGREKLDSYTFAKWGIEYFKYDFCHNIKISPYAPLVYGITVSPKGSSDGVFYDVATGKRFGFAKLMPPHKGAIIPVAKIMTGLDENRGACLFENVVAEAGGEYVLSVNIQKYGRFAKFLLAVINDKERYHISFPAQKHFNNTARFQTVVKLNKGNNTIRLYNPIGSSADSAMLQYREMGKCLIEASQKVARESGEPVKPIVYSICEWGFRKPWMWGESAGNLWRTTPDIRPFWPWIKIIYERNIKLYKYASAGHVNDPDMLEVGNGKLTDDENLSHFALWCMMSSPLILGNDLRTLSDYVKSIVTNKALIAIDQDPLGKQCKRVKKGRVDVLAKPLADGSIAVAFFKKGGHSALNYKFDLRKLIKDEYVSLPQKASYSFTDALSGATATTDGILSAKVNAHGIRVFIVK